MTKLIETVYSLMLAAVLVFAMLAANELYGWW